MKEVAARQDISLKYIERLMPALKSAGAHRQRPRRRRRLPPDPPAGGVQPLGNSDAGGGATWRRCPVSSGTPHPAARRRECRTLPVWRGYYDMTRQYFSGITLADLMNTPQGRQLRHLKKTSHGRAVGGFLPFYIAALSVREQRVDR